MIITKTLPSKATLVMENIPFMRSVAIGIWVKAGSVNETEDVLGISHFIEHMMFKGTKTRSTKAVAEDIDKIGGQINAFTGKETTCYYVKALDSHLEAAADVLFDIFFDSVFDESEMEKEKDVIYEEISMHEDSPEDDIHDVLYAAVFNGSPLATSILGTRDTLKGITRDMALDYIDRRYGPDQVVISVAGNFDKEKVIQICESKFQSLRKTDDAKLDYSKVYTPTHIFKKKDIEQAHVCIGTKGLPLGHKDYYSLATLNNIIGGSMSSRLFQTIREERAMAYSVYSYTSSYIKDGVFAIYAGVNPGRVNEVVDCIIEEIAALKKNGVTPEELSASKEQLKSSHIFGMESVSGRMFSLGRSQLLLGRTFSQEEILEKINSVDMDGMTRMIEHISDTANYSGALLSKQQTELKLQ
jgi:predicted Zn-dependent peptidase